MYVYSRMWASWCSWTNISDQFEFMGGAFYENVVRLSKHITLNQARAIFGFNDSTNIGRIHFGSK